MQFMGAATACCDVPVTLPYWPQYPHQESKMKTFVSHQKGEFYQQDMTLYAVPVPLDEVARQCRP
jgi:hypothetical protein